VAPVTAVVWAGGRLRDPADPVVTALDPGVLTGLGAFETCAVVAGRAFALTRHLDRLAGALAALGLPAVDPDEVRAGVAAVLGTGAPGLGRLRITVTPGAPGASAPTVLVTAGPAPVRGAARAVRVPWVRNERSPLAGHKATSYAADVLALAAATRAGGNEALLASSAGALCEGTGSNVFVERGGELLTPHRATGCLPGVTRALVLAWSAEAGLPVREAAPDELPWAVLDDLARGGAHLALSGSLRGFVPVAALDGTPLDPGPLTAAVAGLFRERAAADLDP
jgi:branched-chain amino acid aminotransferase